MSEKPSCFGKRKESKDECEFCQYIESCSCATLWGEFENVTVIG